MVLRKLIVWLMVGLLAPVWASAQSATTGAIAGVARDAIGAVLPGVTVEAASPALIEKARTAVTDDQGNYKIVDLRPGTYTVTFTLAGFNTYRRAGIELTTGVTVAANAEMKVGGIEETVTVTGASPVVDVQNVRTQNVLTLEVLETIPANRTINGFAQMTLGVTYDARLGAQQDVGGDKGEAVTGVSIHGIGAAESQFTVDGMNINSLHVDGGGVMRLYYPNYQAAQEVVLQTGGITAETERGGLQLNLVPKEGGNLFSGYAMGTGANRSMQSQSLTDELIARGVRTPPSLKLTYDTNVGVGGPIKKDRLWFYAAQRFWGAQSDVPSWYFNATPHTPVYTPDLDRPAYTQTSQRDTGARFTWQASTHNKLNMSANYQEGCICFYTVNTNRVPGGTALIDYDPTTLYQASWSHPRTNRVLLEAGVSLSLYHQSFLPDADATAEDVPFEELSTGYFYNARAESVAIGTVNYGPLYSNQVNERFAVSYVTGSHALKVGLMMLQGWHGADIRLNEPAATAGAPVRLQLRNGVPAGIVQFASPNSDGAKLENIAIYGQDQWTIDRLTLNLGVRFDHLRGWVPERTRPAGYFTPAIDLPRVDDVPKWNNVSPRLGAAFDVFGNGRTAIKGSFGRYMNGQGVGLTVLSSPASAVVGTTNRIWTDADSDFVPDCNLRDPNANGECQAINNRLFGTSVPGTRYSDDVLRDNRGYSWQGSATLQHELGPRIGVQASYHRNWFQKFMVTDNLAVGPGDFDPFCVTAPVDPRLGAVSGAQLCGYYDINPVKFGQVVNEVTLDTNFGEQRLEYDGVDVAMNARFGRGGLLSGGVSFGRTVTDSCFDVDAPGIVTVGVPAVAPQTARRDFCRVAPPWSAGTHVKFSGSYPLPWYDFQVSGAFQDLPGVADGGNAVFTNAQVAPSLGRNLAAGPGAFVVLPIVAPQTMFENRLTQVDFRLTKIQRIGRWRLQGNFDIYNLFNARTILGANPTVGSAYLTPTSVLGGRLFKFGGQVDF